MSTPMIDSHIHFDLYNKFEQRTILSELTEHNIAALISVSMHLESARANLQLSRDHSAVKPAFGFHPEQKLPKDEEITKLFQFIDTNESEIIAVGEVGLPFYLREEHPSIPLKPYIELLEQFMIQAKKLNKPIILHAIYDDAAIACSLLEKHAIKKAHFHWFKADKQTIERLSTNGYFISFTPDILYEADREPLIKKYPLEKIMVETDGPWRFEGPFTGQMTHPFMIHAVLEKIAEIKELPKEEVYQQIYENTKQFYGLEFK